MLWSGAMAYQDCNHPTAATSFGQSGSDAWVLGIAKSIEALGTEEFCEILADALSGLISFDSMDIEFFSRGEPTTISRDGLKAAFSPPRHRRHEASSATPIGRRIDSCETAVFSNFNSDQKETRAIKIAHAFVQDARIVLSLKRDASRPCFTSDEHNRIASARPVIGSLLACQWRGLGFSPIGSSQCFPLPAADDCRKPAAFRCLTKREMDIVAKVIDGYCNESIALDLNISIGTVKVHRKNIYRKLKISSQIELFRLAFRSDAAPAVIATTRSGRSLRSAVVTGGTQPGSGEERVRAAVGAEWF